MGMMINRRRACGGKRLPYDAEIEYLESSGTQWIDTGVAFYVNNTTEVYMNGKFVDTTITNQHICSIGMSRKYVFIGSYIPSGNGNYIYGSNNNFLGTSISLTSDNVSAKIFRNSFNMTNGEHTFNASNGTYNNALDGTTLPLFARDTRKENGYVVPSKAIIYIFRVKVNNTIVRDFIPVRKGQVGYMYDKVSGQLFGNAGTGDFILGPDK